jgi:hypothetical protein
MKLNYPNWSDWKHYFKSSEPWCYHPELFLYDIVDILPSYIDQIVMLGCASGRDFIPFNNKYKLIGFDIAPYEEIVWVEDFKNLEYHECSIKDFIDYSKSNNILIDLSKTLIYSSVTMMYESSEIQNLFFQELINRDCRNFIFSEYLINQPHQVPNGCLQLNPDYFDICRFRKGEGQSQYAHMNLDIPRENMMKLINKGQFYNLGDPYIK